MNISKSKDFLVSSASLKEVRAFSREIFEKININEDLKDELVLAIAEAAQNIVKHAYKNIDSTTDKMEIKISLKDSELEIGFFDKGRPSDSEQKTVLLLVTKIIFATFSIDFASKFGDVFSYNYPTRIYENPL